MRFRPPLLLYSYIATELLAPFFASFIILYGVFFLVRLLPLLEVVLELRIGFADFIRLSSYIFPHMLLYVIPMASMTGVIIGFTRLTNDREILALKACSISLRAMLPPLVIFAATIAILTGFFSVRLIPAGELAIKQLMFQLAKEKIDKGLKEKTFTEALGDMVVYVDRIDEQEEWHGVYVSDMRNRQQPLISMAKRGRMDAEVEKMMVTIILYNGTMHNTGQGDNQVIFFDRYKLQIPLRPPTRIDGDDVTQIERGSMTQGQLWERAQQLGPTTKAGIEHLSEFHQRLALPVGCFILSLLGLPLGLQAGPGKKAAGIPLGLFFFVLYYITLTIGEIGVKDKALPLLAGMWGPNVFFLFLTAIIYWRVERERPLIPEHLQRALFFLHEKIFAPILHVMGNILRFIFSRRQEAPGWKNLFQRQKNQRIPTPQDLHAHPETRIFHLPHCREYTNPQCRITFNNEQIAREAGFEPCPLCGPESPSSPPAPKKQANLP